MKKSKLAIMSAALLLAIASGCNLVNPSTSSEPQPSTSTSSVDTKQEALNEAAEFLYQANKDNNVNTANYKLPAKQFYDGVSYDVTWTATVTSGPAANVTISTTAGEDNYYVVTVVYDPAASFEEVVYTIKATLTDSDGRTAVSKEINKSIPKFVYTSHADYLKAADDTMLNIEGYIAAKYPYSGGKTTVFVVSGNGEGYYVYNMAVTEEQYKNDLVAGNYLVVSGKRGTHYGTAQINEATYKLTSATPATVTPYDATAIFDAATSASAEELQALQGAYVTVKDVYITTAGDNGYYNWTKGGLNSYVRISSSGNCSDLVEGANDAIKEIYKEDAHYGYKADVTGIATLYNGAFYLMPVDENAVKLTSTSMDPAFKVINARDQLTVDAEIFSNLPTTVEGTGTTITWASTAEGVVSADGKVTPKAEPVTTTLTATITDGTNTETKVFKDIVVKLPDVSSIATVDKAIKNLGTASATSVFVIEGVIVAKDSGNRPYVMDSEGNVILVYNNKDANLKAAPVGSTVKLAGLGSAFNGLYQFGNTGTLTVLSISETTTTVNYGAPTAIAAADYVNAVLTSKDETMNGKYVKLTGTYLDKNSQGYLNLFYGEGENKVEIQLQANGMSDVVKEANAGETVTVYGYSYGTNGKVARICATKVVLGEVTDDVVAEDVKSYVYDFGENSEAKHVDGNNVGTSYTAEVGKSTLELTELTNVYGPAYDAKGNSCLKLGTGSKTASLTFTVGADITKVVIHVAKYKSNDTVIAINGTEYTLTKNSNDGEYDVIEIDTTTTKTIVLATVSVSGKCRCMINTIELHK